MDVHTLKQLQFVGFGAATSYYLDTFTKLRHILDTSTPYSVPWCVRPLSRWV